MAEKITMEEYNRQKDEYTNQALKELHYIIVIVIMIVMMIMIIMKLI